MSIMDTTGFSQVGKYGTLSLLKKQENTVITSFGIDTEELTFGRDPSCSVRLYYPDVSLVHCKIVFEERKAFLAILGEGGLLVDGCEVYPNSNSGGSPTMVPLSNNSEIVIRQKRFKFTYPPKDMRAALLATPSPTRRKLRLSMIQSAQVFTPRPSNDPRENLRILQSPLKNQFKSPVKPSLLSRPPANAQPEPEEEDEIVLVDGNHPRVVEEERDLVILEDVPEATPLVKPSRSNYPPKTPPRRKSRNTLHRAVLIRSAQRAVLRAEEEEEELEVLSSVVVNPESGGEDEQDDDDGAFLRGDGPADVEMEDVDMEDGEAEPEPAKLTWRKSLGRIWPFNASQNDKEESSHDEEMEEHEEHENEDDNDENEGIENNNQRQEEENEDEDEEYEEPAPLPSIPAQTPARRPLGSFLTPQIRHAEPSSPVPYGSRLSLGGEARRVLVEQPWRVKDLVVSKDADIDKPLPPTVKETPRRPQTSEEERKAIQERRRSAWRQPDNFFPGGVPGLSPSKPSTSATPLRPSIPLYSSPVKGSVRRTSADEEDLDTRSLLEKMKETVETMKRRKSLAPVMDATPQQLFSTPRQSIPNDLGPVFSSVKKLNLGPVPSTSGSSVDLDAPEKEEKEENTAPTVAEDDEEETFSLLKPEARKEASALRMSVAPVADTEVEPQPSETQPSIPSIVEAMDVDEEPAAGTGADDHEEQETRPNPAPRSRLLRPKKLVPTASDSSLLSADQAIDSAAQPRRRSPRPRSRSPLPDPEAGGNEDPTPVVTKPTATRHIRKEVPEASKQAPGKRTARASPIESEESEPTAGPARRGRKAATEAPAAAEKPAPTARRGRKPAVVKEEQTDDVNETVAAPGKRSGRRTPAAQSTSEQSDAAPEDPVRKSRMARTTTAAAKKRVTKAAAATRADPEEVEDDPLDSIAEDAAPSKTTEAAAQESSKGKGKKKIVEVKQEEDGGASAAAATKPARGRAAASGLKTPAVTRPRAARKTPATAPAAIQGGDKENTPGGSGAGPSNAGAAGGGDVQDAVVKLKVSRSRGKATAATTTAKAKAAAVKTEAGAEEAPRTATRATRATRARTKTG